jgi:hypothetical protein
MRPLNQTQKQRLWIAGFAALIGIPALIIAVIALSTSSRPQIAETPAGEMLGVDPRHYEYAEQAFAAYPQAFMADAAAGQENARKNARIWLLTRNVSVPGKPAGQDFGCGPQQTGDCVSWGWARPISECLASQIALGKASGGGVVFQPHQYGVTRRDGDQHGYGKIGCNSAGAIPSLAALNFDKFGLVFYHEVEADGIKYSGRLADEWGCKGVPEKWLRLGKTRSGGEAYPIRSLEELRDALCNSYPCSYAGPFTPGRKYVADGRNCMTWDGRLLGYHQMCILAYDGSLGPGKEYFFVQNSHGPESTAATRPLGDEPEGGFWVSWATMKSMLDRKGEIWACSAVAGFEANDIDWSAWDVFQTQPIPQRAAPNQGENDEVRADDRRSGVARAARLLAL